MLTAQAGLIATAYALGAVVEFTGPVARGEQGEVWRLETDRGTWAVKRSFGGFTAADAQRSGTFQRLARRHGVNAPEPMTTVDGSFGHLVAGTVVRVQSWVEVLDADPTIDPAAVGAAVARLHRVPAPADGTPDPVFTDPVGAAGWDAIVAESRRQRAPFAEQLAGFRNELVALEALVGPMVPVQTCHLDLWADNLRRTPEGELAVLDWDSCGPADPSRELALVLFEYAHRAPGRAGPLYAAYRDAGGPGRVETPADFSLLIAFLGQIAAHQLRRWLDPARFADRDRALGWVREFLDDPLTRATIDDLLAELAEAQRV